MSHARSKVNLGFHGDAQVQSMAVLGASHVASPMWVYEGFGECFSRCSANVGFTRVVLCSRTLKVAQQKGGYYYY